MSAIYERDGKYYTLKITTVAEEIEVSELEYLRQRVRELEHNCGQALNNNPLRDVAA